MSFVPDSTLKAITLNDYDMVVAVTQVAINETMGEYLYNQPLNFTILGITDSNGTVIKLTTDPALSTCSLSGTLALEKDPNTGKYINLVDLITPKGNQTVQYNITMQNGEFKYNAQGINYDKKQDSTAAWVFRIFVDLAMEPISKSQLPADPQEKLASIDENMFSIQQLYLDLNTAALNTIDGVTFPALVQTPALELLTLYLAQQQQASKPLFGVTVCFNNQTVQPPTLTPTFVDFCITPYTDSLGNKSNPNLDTLNYLVMVNHNPPPKTPPLSFNFNWVTDEQIMGVMAIRENEFSPSVINELNPILKTLCPIMHCKANGIDNTVIQLKTGIDHTFNRYYNPSDKQIAYYNYPSKDSDKIDSMNYSTTVWGSYSMATTILVDSDVIRLSGIITASAQTDTLTNSQNGTHDDSVIMPNTTWAWAVDLELYFNLKPNGQLDLRITNPRFDSAPTVESHNESWWEKFLDGLSGSMLSYTQNLGNLRESVSYGIEGDILPKLTEILATTNLFIFPGAKTFAFKNPQFSNSMDMVSNITYLNPNT